MPRRSSVPRKGTANRLVAEAIIPLIALKAEEVVEVIRGPIDEAVDDFFHDLAGYMGDPRDPSSQGRPGMGFQQTWTPLNADYVKQKGTAAFWLYTMAPLVQRKRRSVIRGIHGVKAAYRSKLRAMNKDSDPLIQRFQRSSGLAAFGGCIIEIDKSKTTPEILTSAGFLSEPRTVLGKRTSGVSHTKQRKIKPFKQRFYTRPIDFRALKVTFNIRLWSKFSKVSINGIEVRLAMAGFFPQKTLAKLLGHVHRRPLIRPFMAFYSEVVIPYLIDDALKERYSTVKGRSVPISAKVTSNGSL